MNNHGSIGEGRLFGVARFLFAEPYEPNELYELYEPNGRIACLEIEIEAEGELIGSSLWLNRNTGAEVTPAT